MLYLTYSTILEAQTCGAGSFLSHLPHMVNNIFGYRTEVVPSVLTVVFCPLIEQVTEPSLFCTPVFLHSCIIIVPMMSKTRTTADSIKPIALVTTPPIAIPLPPPVPLRTLRSAIIPRIRPTSATTIVMKLRGRAFFR